MPQPMVDSVTSTRPKSETSAEGVSVLPSISAAVPSIETKMPPMSQGVSRSPAKATAKSAMKTGSSPKISPVQLAGTDCMPKAARIW